MLYNYPGTHVQNWGVSFDPNQLRTIKEGVQGWEIDAYLPAETLKWCKDALQSLDFNPQAAPLDRTTFYRDIYIQLREKAQFHTQNNFNPALSLLQSPVGARNWQVSAMYDVYTSRLI
jgi:hypothetical protein